MIKDFTDLEIWQLACELIIEVYQLLKDFPPEEKYGLTSQIKDAVISIASNIAEGYGRFYYKDRIKFYYNSRGSLSEVKSHLLIADKLCFIKSRQKFQEILLKIEKLAVKINNYISFVSKQSLNHK